MFTTKKLYEENPNLLVCSANVLDVMQENDLSVVVLDQTVFRPHPPSAAPQPSASASSGAVSGDIGLIESEDKRFHVRRIEQREDFIRHIGSFESDPFDVDEMVVCTAEEEFSKEVEENNID